MNKQGHGNFFEDFSVGQVLRHATPRTVTSGDVALYGALFGSRFAVQSSDEFAREVGYPRAPVDDLLVFHIVFGKTVPDVSYNAVANLGYAECRFLKTVYPDDTLRAESEVIGRKENSSGKTGIVYVRSCGINQNGETVLSFVRWVMVKKRGGASGNVASHVPQLEASVAATELGVACPDFAASAWDKGLSGSPYVFDDYAVGEKIDHGDGMTVEEAEHQMATRAYQNTAKIHFNQHVEAGGKFGRRLVYGGHVMSLARALSFNGLGNAWHVAAINGGRHVAPFFAGGTVYAWSEIQEKAFLPALENVGALRIITRATYNEPCAQFPTAEATADEPGVILELDYWVLVPR